MTSTLALTRLPPEAQALRAPLRAFLDEALAGMPADRVSAASYGETQPVAKNETAEGRAANRRIELHLIGQAPPP